MIVVFDYQPFRRRGIRNLNVILVLYQLDMDKSPKLTLRLSGFARNIFERINPAGKLAFARPRGFFDPQTLLSHKFLFFRVLDKIK
ncbi:MAG: hypothetical protein MUC97_18700 [Bernardetiaceae bacterium]|jgi:hypothetical protein|nr:hypothetical protein [Bernardetiaceae bacterium]